MTFLKSVQRTLSANTDKLLLLSICGFFLASLGYVLFSYGLTAPNLVLSTWEPYWQFQTSMWKLLFNNRTNLTSVYSVVLLVFFISYLSLVSIFKSAQHQLVETRSLLGKLQSLSSSKLLFVYICFVLPMLFASNALSYDIFNYLFNAKMVVAYQANPHTQTALEFSDDPWVRFMHNVHTPAPYWYGWTAISLIPYSLGFGKLLSTWLAFRVFSLVSIVVLAIAIKQLAHSLNHKLSLHDYALVFLNPLFVIEILGNSHNDLWMLIPAIWGLSLLLKPPLEKIAIKPIAASILLLAISASIKLATVSLIPVWALCIGLQAYGRVLTEKLQKRFHLPVIVSEKVFGMLLAKITPLLPFFASVLLFIPLFSTRSQQYLPWYLTWSLVWLPVLNTKLWKQAVIVASVGALLRYIPWLLNGEYTAEVLYQQKLLTWLPLLLYFLIALVRFRRYNTE